MSAWYVLVMHEVKREILDVEGGCWPVHAPCPTLLIVKIV